MLLDAVDDSLLQECLVIEAEIFIIKATYPTLLIIVNLPAEAAETICRSMELLILALSDWPRNESNEIVQSTNQSILYSPSATMHV